MPAEPARKTISEAEYLALEERSEERHEYFDGQVFPIAGASIRHNQIVLNMALALRALKSPCGVTVFDVKFKKRTRTLYPDLMVSCAPVEDAHVESKPCMIVEVLSPTTEAFDRGDKMHTYIDTPELEAYLMVSQSERRVDVLRRAGAVWRYSSATEGGFDLPCPPGVLTLDELYADIEFDDAGIATA